MPAELTPDEVKRLLAEARRRVRGAECLTCSCFQGILTQIELDAGEAAAALLDSLKVESAKLHPCLGCEPCAAGDLYALYARDYS